MLIHALGIAIWAGIAGLDMFNGLTHVHRPLVTGAVVGFILGDLTTGIIVGATLDLVWMGLIPIGGALPPNVVIGGIIGTSLAILAHVDSQAAVGLAMPFAVAVQALLTLLNTALSPLMHVADRYAENADYNGIYRINYAALAIMFIFYFIIAFLPIYFGASQAAVLVQALPDWIIGGLSLAGGIMPAVGLAMLLKVMLKKEYTGYFILGFLLAAYLKLPIMAIALMGLAVALFDYFRSSAEPKVETGETSRDEEDYSDGI